MWRYKESTALRHCAEVIQYFSLIKTLRTIPVCLQDQTWISRVWEAVIGIVSTSCIKFDGSRCRNTESWILLALPIILSHEPPKCDAWGRIMTHELPLPAELFYHSIQKPETLLPIFSVITDHTFSVWDAVGLSTLNLSKKAKDCWAMITQGFVALSHSTLG